MECLHEAIRAGEIERARQIAYHLALAHQEKNNANKDELPADHIYMRVHVEDRESSGTYILLKVRPSYTLGELKRKMMLDYDIPEEVQCWIINRKISPDTVRLDELDCHSSEFSAYLYLRSAEDVGLDREKYDNQRKQIVDSLLHPPQQDQLGDHSGPEIHEQQDLHANTLRQPGLSLNQLTSDDFRMEPMLDSQRSGYGSASAFESVG